MKTEDGSLIEQSGHGTIAECGIVEALVSGDILRRWIS